MYFVPCHGLTQHADAMLYEQIASRNAVCMQLESADVCITVCHWLKLDENLNCMLTSCLLHTLVVQ